MTTKQETFRVWLRERYGQDAAGDLVEAVREVHARTREQAHAAFHEGDPDAAAELHRAATDVFLTRFEDPLCSAERPAEGPAVEAFLSTFAEEWFAVADEPTRALVATAPRDASEYVQWLTGLVASARCTAKHPLFDRVEHSATHAELAEYLRAENLCDLYFADMLSLLMPGLRGLPKLELAQNFWDEIGQGAEDAIHRNLRLEMMARVGLPVGDAAIELSQFPPEELEHFNAYCISSQYRRYAPRLVGMMLATEVLVPAQLERTIAGWRRVGLSDSDLRYMLEHVETDVAHGDGWVNRVVAPVLAARPDVGPDIAAGALHHLEILSRLYDRLHASWTAAEG